MFSKTRIEQMIDSEDGTVEKSLENAKTIMHGSGYECDGLRISFDPKMNPKWTVCVHFTHTEYTDVIEHRFTGFNLDTQMGARGLEEFFEMFNIHPHFSPFQPRERYSWGCYAGREVYRK